MKSSCLALSVVLSSCLVASTGAVWAAGDLAAGTYECWYFTTPQSGMNFTVTSPGTYRSEADGSEGTYSVADDGAVTFTGAVAGSIPAGYTAVYQVSQGRPRVSIMSPRGAEAMFCQPR